MGRPQHLKQRTEVHSEVTSNVFCHFSAIEDSKYVVLEIGDEVRFTWNEVAQDGCQYSAVHVTSGRAGKGTTYPQRMPYSDNEDLGGYESSLEIVLKNGNETET